MAQRDAFNSSPTLLLKEKGEYNDRRVLERLSGTHSTHPPINWGHGPNPSLKREGLKGT